MKTMVQSILTLALLALIASYSAGQNVETIIQNSVQANARDWKADPEYSWFERDREPHGGTKTFDDLMIFGSPYQRLVAVNGQPLSHQRQEQERQKLEQTISERRNESPESRASRIAKYQKDRKRDRLLMEQLTHAFKFKLIGEQKLDGYDVYVLKATPLHGYLPPNMDTQVLKGMEGKLWIDKKTYQWVKVEAHVIHPVSIEGFLAQVEPGTEFELEKMAVDDDIWLPKHYSMRAHAKIFFLFGHKSQDDETYYQYRKISPDQALSEAR
ncbi:MAG: hypothetical protein WCF22_23275 [Candidatus Sulfotelmatobacter sp.]